MTPKPNHGFHLPPTVTRTILIGYLGFLGLALYRVGDSLSDIKHEQGEMHARVDYTSDRVDRIVNEVPTLRGAIVRENARAPVRQAIVTTPPQRRDTATSIATINVIDIRSGRTTAHYLTLSNEQAAMFGPVVKGVVAKSAPNALSLVEITGYSQGTYNASVNSARVPNYVDANSTYILWASTDTVPIVAIETMFKVDSTRSFPVTIRGGESWLGVVQEINAHPRIYSVMIDKSRTPKPQP